MLRLLGSKKRCCDGLSRRDWLQIGGSGLLGFGLAEMLRLQAQAAPKAVGYTLIKWTGPTPAEHYGRVAAVLNAMNDAPHTVALASSRYPFGSCPTSRRTPLSSSSSMRSLLVRIRAPKKTPMLASFHASLPVAALTQRSVDAGCGKRVVDTM